MTLRQVSVALTLFAASVLPFSLLAGPEMSITELSQDHMVDHPAGSHSVLWNGPAVLDVGVPSGAFVRFAVANLTPQWSLLLDSQGQPLPVAVRSTGRGLTIRWLPYDGPVRPKGTSSDADYLKALQNINAARYQGLMTTARGINGSR